MATNTATSRTPLEVRTASYVSTYTSIHTALMFPKLFSSSMTASTLLSTFNTHVRTLNTLDKRLFLSVPVSVYMCGQQKRANQKDGVFFDDGFKFLWLCWASTCVSKVLRETWQMCIRGKKLLLRVIREKFSKVTFHTLSCALWG